MLSSMVMWEHKAQAGTGIKLEAVEGFSARGMTRLYGRGDHFGRRTFNLDLWKTRDGRVFSRFWSHSNEVDGESWAVIGGHTGGKDDQQVPQLLRDRYEAWTRSNI